MPQARHQRISFFLSRTDVLRWDWILARSPPSYFIRTKKLMKRWLWTTDVRKKQRAMQAWRTDTCRIALATCLNKLPIFIRKMCLLCIWAPWVQLVAGRKMLNTWDIKEQRKLLRVQYAFFSNRNKPIIRLNHKSRMTIGELPNLTSYMVGRSWGNESIWTPFNFPHFPVLTSTTIKHVICDDERVVYSPTASTSVKWNKNGTKSYTA